jgi:hypothetical protein
MPYQQGTATGYLDLLSKLCAFLSGESMGTQAWTVLKNTTSTFTTDGEVYLKGPGLTGVDSVYVSIKTSSNVPSGIYHWIIQGGIGFNTGLAFDAQPGCIPATVSPPRLPLLNSSMAYTIVANGRRFVVIAYAGTVCESCYAGWITPRTSSTRWPEPLFVGAMGYASTLIPSTSDAGHTWWLRDQSATAADSSPAYLRSSDGTWRRLRQYSSYAVYGTNPFVFAWPAAGAISTNLMAPCIGGEYALEQMDVLINDSLRDAVVGAFDGIFWVTGYGMTAGDTFTIDGVTYLALQNAHRTGVDDFAAIALE